jgi:hypothetical protein
MRMTFPSLPRPHARARAATTRAAATRATVVRAATASALAAPGSLLGGCNGALWGNVVVLGITVGIFFGTLTLGRSTDARAGSASRSTPSGKAG